jgi:asparagine synthetase B (glutamine-hydrolysing)
MDSPAAPGARVGILFSGGVDCTLLALLTDKFLPEAEPIDLLNVSFENPRSLQNRPAEGPSSSSSSSTPSAPRSPYDVPDRLTGRASAEELATLRPRRRWWFVEVDVPYEECTREKGKVAELMRPSSTVMDLVRLSLSRLLAGNGVLTRA